LMATDSVPKFIKTSRFMALRNWVEEYEVGEADMVLPTSPSPRLDEAVSVTTSTTMTPPGLDNPEEIGRAYMSVSLQAIGRKSEKEPANSAGGGVVSNPLQPTKSV